MSSPIDELNVLNFLMGNSCSDEVGTKGYSEKRVNLAEYLQFMEVMTVPILIHLVGDRPLIDAYCRRNEPGTKDDFSVSLVEIDINREEGVMPQGLMYFFINSRGENLGGFTRKGLINSLRDYNS